tara:strand:- start:1431 stop:1562 length:132 start_codon:yes stop_codon:yes gene_type:complete
MDDMEKFAVDFDIIRELNPAQVDNVAGGGTESTISRRSWLSHM